MGVSMKLPSPANLLWLFGHFVLILLGALVLIGSHLFPQLSKGIIEAVGGGLIATGVAGEVLFLYVMASETTRARLELFTNAGLLKIFPHRSVRMREEYDSRLMDAKEIDVLGFGQSSFRQDYGEKFKQLSVQATVRILLIDPEFPSPQHNLAGLRDIEENNQVGQIRSDVEAFEATVKQVVGLNRNRFKIKKLRAIPAISLFRIDDIIFWGPYLIGQPSRNMPTLLVQRGGFLFDRLKGHFDQIWESDLFSHPVHH
jgi:hypothetical protein